MSEKPTIPPPPNYPPRTPAAPAEDWWDALYDERPDGTDLAAPVRGGGRLPHWRTGQHVDVTKSAEPDTADEPEVDQAPDADEQEQPDPAEETEAQHDRGDDEQPDPATAAIPSARPVSKKPAASAGPSRWRFVAFNGAAAGIGYGLGLVDTLGAYLPAAEQAATGMVGTVMAAAGGVAAWRLTGLPAVDAILPDARTRARLVLSIGAAELGRRLAPAPVAWLAEHGTNIGLGPNAVALLLTVGGMCGGMWWLIDRHTRRWWWGGRLLLRIPLASALLATALYAPGLAP